MMHLSRALVISSRLFNGITSPSFEKKVHTRAFEKTSSHELHFLHAHLNLLQESAPPVLNAATIFATLSLSLRYNLSNIRKFL